MKAKNMKTIHATIPEQHYRQLEGLVKDGWFKSEEDVLEGGGKF
jgi:Arc/MetJ-type ribon-helix-helix transcriptional regulator